MADDERSKDYDSGTTDADDHDYGHAAGAPSSDPEQRLKELQHKVDHDAAEIARLSKHKDKLALDIAALTTDGDSIKVVVAAYTTARPALVRDEHDDETYLETKMRMILCAIEESKDSIDNVIGEYDECLEENREKAEQSKAKKAEAQSELDLANADLAKRESRFEFWKALQARIEAWLADAADLKKRIETEDDSIHTASMYFLALELQSVLDKTKIISVDELKSKLYKAWNAMSEAKAAVRHKQSHLDVATAAYTAAQAAYADMLATRREKILELVAPFNASYDDKKVKHA